MSPNEMLERAGSVRDSVLGRPRISATELARSKDWRERLPKEGVIEVTDRGGTAGWLVSDEDMRSLVEGYAYLEQEVERAQVAAMLGARRGSKPLSGEALGAAVLEAHRARKDELRGIVDGR